MKVIAFVSSRRPAAFFHLDEANETDECKHDLSQVSVTYDFEQFFPRPGKSGLG